MSNDVDFIKKAIVGELESMQVYRILANDAQNEDLKDLFLNLANSEQLHLHLLQSMYFELTHENYIPKMNPIDPNTPAEALIDQQITKEIAAIESYQRQATLTNNPRFKSLYTGIANDENIHTLKLLN